MVDISTCALTLLLSTSALTDRGASGFPPWELEAQRRAPRLRLNLAGLIAVKYSSAFWGGAGVSLDAGVTLIDRLAFFVHAESATTITTISMGGGVGAEWALNEAFTVGVGANLDAGLPLIVVGYSLVYQSFLALTFPIRAQVMFRTRGDSEVAREGLTLGVSVAPGVNAAPTYDPNYGAYLPPFQSFAISVGLTLGYSRW